MKLINPSFEIIEQEFPHQKMDMDSYEHQKALEDAMYKHIELCGRTCYKSQDKITEDSAKPFVDRMITSKHYAMLEHGTVYLCIAGDGWYTAAHKYFDNKYSKCRMGFKDFELFVTTNLRVLAENNWLDDLKYLCEPTMFHKKRYTVKFICNRQVSHEFVRHRVFSFAQESTRFCNYSSNKFSNELTFIRPCWCNETLEETSAEEILKSQLQLTEEAYMQLVSRGWKPQEAATVLPNALKTELIMTGFEDDWCHFFELRALGATGAPHPQAKELAEPLMKEFINRGYIKDLTSKQD